MSYHTWRGKRNGWTYANVGRHKLANIEGLNKRTHAVKEDQEDAGHQAVATFQPLAMGLVGI
jgi:hypothetical protein